MSFEYDLKQVQQHTVAALAATDIEKLDYQYMTIKDLFPEEFYSQLTKLEMSEIAHIVCNVFANEDFAVALKQKFAESPIRSETIKSVYAFWQSHGTGYTLKPHVDSFPRVFTMTVYLAENDDHPEAGTSVYAVDTNTREYETVGLMPYLRNSTMVICPYDMLTWHGVEMLEADIDRRSVVVVFSAQDWNKDQMHYAEWKPGVTVNYEL